MKDTKKEPDLVAQNIIMNTKKKGQHMLKNIKRYHKL